MALGRSLPAAIYVRSHFKQLGIVLTLIAAVAVIALFHGISRPYPDWDVVSAAEDAVRKRLGDPDTVQFKEVATYTDAANSGHWVCGWANWRGPSGQYVGFRHFSAHVPAMNHANDLNGGVSLLLADSEVNALLHAWMQNCRPSSN